MRPFQPLLLLFNLALFLECQGVPASDFFATEGLIGTADNGQAISPILATHCGEVSTLDVCSETYVLILVWVNVDFSIISTLIKVSLTGASNLSNGSAQLVTFTPFLVALADLNNGGDNDEYQLQLNILLSNPSDEVVSKLETLYDKYFPRDAKVTPLNIKRLMGITWDLTTGSSESLKVSALHVLG